MATHDIKLKKYVAGTTNAWEDAYPETTHTQIIATGTADSTTFLRGDGAWAVPAGSTTAGSAEKVTLQVRFGEAVSKGDPVYISGYHGSTGPVIMSKAKANDSAKMPAFGLADDDYAENATGYAVSIGVLEDVDTDSYTVGDTLYVAPTGGLTDTKPTGSNLIQNVGTVSRSNLNNGSIEVTATGRSNDVPNLTTGKLWVGSANNTIESATLHLDETNNRLGIGATSPAYKLDVRGEVRGFNYRVDDYIRHTGDDDTYIRFVGGDDLQLVAGGRQMLRMDEGTDPDKLRFVTDNDWTNSSGNWNMSGDVTVGGNVTIDNSSELTFLMNGQSYGSSLYVDSSDNTLLNARGGSGKTLTLRTYSGSGWNTGLVMDDAGNVGIGSTSAYHDLQVGSLVSTTTIGTVGIKSNGSGYAIFMEEPGTGSESYAIGVDTAGNLNFHNSGSSTPSVRFMDNDNVGIGVTTPDAKLDVAGFVQLDYYAAGTTVAHNAGYLKIRSASKTGWGPGDELGKIEFYSNDGSGIGARNAASIRVVNNQGNGSTSTTFEGELALYTSAYNSTETEKVRITGDGKVGIGTTTPPAPLSIRTTTDDDYALHIRGTVNNVAGDWTGIGISGEDLNTKGAILYESLGSSYSRGKLHFALNNELNQNSATPNDAIMTLLPSGEVGIGTTSPTSKINIDTGSEEGIAIFRNTTNANFSAIEFRKSNNTDLNAKIGFNNEELRLDAKSDTRFTINDVDAMFINSSRNVGIGTTSPSNKFQVVGNARVEGNFMAGDAASTNTPAKPIHIKGAGEQALRIEDTTSSNQVFDITVDQTAGFKIKDITNSLTPFSISTSGDVTITGDLNVSGTYTQIHTDTTTTEQWLVTNDGTGPAVIINQKGTQPVIDIQDDGTSAFYIEDGGNVGIGTTNPTTDLEVVGRTLSTTFSTTTTSTRDKYRLYNTSSQYAIGMQDGVTYGGLNDWAMTFQFSNSADRGFWWGDSSHTTAQGAMALTTDGKLSVATRARIGYGESDTTSPATYALDVSGNSYIDATSASATLTLGRYSGNPTIKAGTDDSGYLIMDSSGGKLGLNWYSSDNVVINNGGGNTGIGTASPSDKLHIEGNQIISKATTGGQNQIRFQEAGTTKTQITSNYGDNKFYLYHEGDNRMVINSSGQVGIGTTSPDAKLNVAEGNSGLALLGIFENTTNAGGTSAGIQLRNASDTDVCAVQLSANRVAANAGSDFVIELSNASPGTLTERFRITEAGNVGIGTTSPSAKLEVHTANSSDATTWKNADGERIANIWSNAAGGMFELYKNGSKTIQLHGYDGDSYFTGTGNVGIGTSSPSYKLDVAGSARFDGPFLVETNSTSSRAFYVSRTGTTQALRFYTTDSTSHIDTIQDENTGSYGSLAISADMQAPDSYISLTGNTVRLLGGNVGVGTTSPGSPLTVAGTIESLPVSTSEGGDLRLRAATGKSYQYTIDNYNDTLRFIRQDDTTGSSGQVRMLIDSSGNVGVGTASPGEKLEVDGAVIIGDSKQGTATTTLTTTTQTALFTFAKADYDGGKFVITAVDSSNKHITELLVLHDGTTAVATEYGVILTTNSLFSTDVDISGSDVRILVTSASTNSTVYKIKYDLI